MTDSNKKAVSLVIISFGIVQIIITVAKYLQLFYNLDNPLIPQNLILGIRNYSVVLLAIYIVPVLVNIFYIIKKRYFLPVMFISFFVLLGVTICSNLIHKYCIA